MNDYLYLGALGIFLVALFSRRAMKNETWRATMTPLASIIGSGFLISAPILGRIGGTNAPYLMLALCAVAFAIGQVIRWNIQTIEPLLQQGAGSGLRMIEKLSGAALAFAYVLSITYYISLFAAFVLKETPYSGDLPKQIVTTITLISIAIYGHRSGLDSIEKIEGPTINIKLSLILTFVLALIVYAFHSSATPSSAALNSAESEHPIPLLLGLLIMVQGFETSRYLSEKHSAAVRTRSMLYAQLISSAIYVIFIALFTPVMEAHPIHGAIRETSIIDISHYVLSWGPLLLVIAAVASQLSAAAADMGGSGGLVDEITHGRIKSRNAYLAIAGVGIALVWLSDIFEIIAYASKAFALYYFLQCGSLCFATYRKNWLKFCYAVIFAAVCLGVIVWSVPFES